MTTSTRPASAQRNWYLVYTKPQQESLAAVNLENQGYQIYVPMIRNARRKLGRRIIRIEPMFPRYLFIYLDTQTDNWAPIRSTIGVSGLVKFGPYPSPVSDQLIALIKQRDDSEGVQDIPLYEFTPGQQVRIEEGPFEGYEGLLLAKTGQERVVVLLDIVGKQAKARVKISALGPSLG